MFRLFLIIPASLQLLFCPAALANVPLSKSDIKAIDRAVADYQQTKDLMKFLTKNKSSFTSKNYNFLKEKIAETKGHTFIPLKRIDQNTIRFGTTGTIVPVKFLSMENGLLEISGKEMQWSEDDMQANWDFIASALPKSSAQLIQLFMPQAHAQTGVEIGILVGSLIIALGVIAHAATEDRKCNQLARANWDCSSLLYKARKGTQSPDPKMVADLRAVHKKLDTLFNQMVFSCRSQNYSEPAQKLNNCLTELEEKLPKSSASPASGPASSEAGK